MSPAEETHHQQSGLTEETINALRQLAGDQVESYPLAEGQLRIVRADLGDHAVVSVAREDGGTVWLIMDVNQPDTRRHLQELLAHWPEDLDEEIAGVVERVVGLAPAPEDDEDEPEDDAESG